MKGVCLALLCCFYFLHASLAAWETSEIPTEEELKQTGIQALFQFENEKVHACKVIILPHQPLRMHRYDKQRVVVALKGGTLRRIEEDGREFFLVFETGRAYWFDVDPEGQLHAEVNESKEPIELIIIECF